MYKKIYSIKLHIVTLEEVFDETNVTTSSGRVY